MAEDNPWFEYTKKYDLHPETLNVGQIGKQLGLKGFANQSLEDARKEFDMTLSKDPPLPFDGTIKEIAVPSKNVEGGIPTSIYRSSMSTSQTPVILLFFHGGGLVCCSRKTHDSCVRTIAANTGAVVVYPEYRLLPCAQDPMAPINDCLEVTKWVMNNKKAVGGAAGSKVGVCGDSSGGMLTLLMASQVKDIAFQIPVYPVCDVNCDLPSFKEFLECPGFNAKDMAKMFSLTTDTIPGAATNPRINPSAIKNMKDFPPTLMILAELDPLVDQGKIYAGKLKDAGVKVQLELIKGVPHSFFSMVQEYPTTSAVAHKLVTDFIKSFQ